MKKSKENESRIENKTIHKINEMIKGKLVTRLEIYDNNKTNELLKSYSDGNVDDIKDIRASLEEYDNGIRHLIIKGKRKDSANILEDFEEHIIIKNNKNVIGYSIANSRISYLQIFNSDLDANKLLFGQDTIDRTKFLLSIDNERRFYTESYREAGNDKVMLERFRDYGKKDYNMVEIYYDIMGAPLYETVYSNDGKVVNLDGVMIYESLNSTNDELDKVLVVKK